MTASAAALHAWNPEAVIATAKELIHTSNYEKVAEARATVDTTIDQWVQVASNDPVVRADATLHRQAEQAIVRAWALYAALEIELRQFKQATKVFECGASCPIGGCNAAFWLQYADFCIDRKKFSNARKVFVRALRAVPEADHNELWTRFHAFVAKELDPNMTLPALQAQVFPGKEFSTQPAAGSEPKSSVGLASADSSKESVNTGQIPEAHAEPQPTSLTGVEAAVQNGSGTGSALPVDPGLAFIDKKGDATASSPDPSAGGKRKAVESMNHSPMKQAKTAPTEETVTIAGSDDLGSFLEIPTTLPITPGCPHLLFDQMESQPPIKNELLEKLSHVLSDNAVFEGVKDLYDNQRQRDRDMLYRWQDLVGMQMKEGSELFARHMDLEKAASEPRALIDLKAKHYEQRVEFANRCRMSQQQFIEICEMDRVGALKAQQISLENLKIPELTVTTDAKTIELQRAIVGLILEAEKLSREENAKKSADSQQVKKPRFAAKSVPPRQRSDSRDRDRIGSRGGRGGNYGRGGGSFGRNGGFRRPYADSPPRSGRGSGRRNDGYAPQSAPPPRAYDNAPRQSHGSYQGNSQRTFAPGPPPGRGYTDYPQRDRQSHFDRGQDRRQPSYNRGPLPEVAAAPLRFADGPPTHSGPGYGPQDPMHQTGVQVGGQGGRGPRATRHVEYERAGRYGGPLSQDGAAYLAPPPSRYVGEQVAPSGRYAEPVPVNRYGEAAPAPSRYGGEQVGPPQYSAPPTAYEYAPPSAPYDYQSHPPPQQQQQPQHAHYGQPAPVYSQPPSGPAYQLPPPQQHLPLPQHQQPQHGYGAPPVYQQQHNPPSHLQQQQQQNQLHHQQQYQTQPHHQPQQHRPQQHRQPYHQTSPPRGGGRGGYDRHRRGGGGGGRYGRR